MFRDIVPKPLFGTLPRTHERLFSPSIRALSWVGALYHNVAVDSGQRSPRIQPSFRQLAALGGVFESRLASPVVFQKPITDLVEIVGQDAQPDVSLKARPPFVGTPIQPMVLQGIDVRFDRTVLSP